MKKRWLLAILILVVVGVVLTIVFINLFSPKNTKALAKDLNGYVTSGFLAEDDQTMKDVDEYLTSLENLAALSEKRDEFENYQYALSVYHVAGEFFNREMIFTKYTDVYGKLHGQVSKSLKNAQKSVNSLKKYFETNDVKVENNDNWLQLTWQDTEKYVVGLVKNTQNALTNLAKIYASCVKTKIYNNNLTDLIFSEMETTYTAVLNKQVGTGNKLAVLVTSYLNGSDKTQQKIAGFEHNADLKDQVKDLQEKGTESVYYPTFIGGQLFDAQM